MDCAAALQEEWAQRGFLRTTGVGRGIDGVAVTMTGAVVVVVMVGDKRAPDMGTSVLAFSVG